MSDCCPLCDHPLSDVTWYVRWFNKGGRFEHCLTREIRPSKRRFPRGMITVNGTDQQSVDIVNMATGTVVRNDFKRPLDDWLQNPTKRAIAVATGELPLIYKNSAVEKASRKNKVDPVAQTA